MIEFRGDPGFENILFRLVLSKAYLPVEISVEDDYVTLWPQLDPDYVGLWECR